MSLFEFILVFPLIILILIFIVDPALFFLGLFEFYVRKLKKEFPNFKGNRFAIIRYARYSNDLSISKKSIFALISIFIYFLFWTVLLFWGLFNLNLNINMNWIIFVIISTILIYFIFLLIFAFCILFKFNVDYLSKIFRF